MKTHITILDDTQLKSRPLCNVHNWYYGIALNTFRTTLKRLRNRKELCETCRRLYNANHVTKKAHYL